MGLTSTCACVFCSCGSFVCDTAVVGNADSTLSIANVDSADVCAMAVIAEMAAAIIINLKTMTDCSQEGRQGFGMGEVYLFLVN